MFEGFWKAFDTDYMNSDMTEVERDDFIMAVAEVNMFDFMSDDVILATFDHYDLNDDGILSKQEASLGFSEGMTILEVAQQTVELWDSIDHNQDDILDQTEFLAGVSMLTTSGVLPEIDSAEVATVYDNLLAYHNASAA